ncbi:MAG: hypothetical protein J6P02_03790 [Lachnospiraceae bacterium]|nr:hypothetical protein [Lachnospiraceae bacterium]
MKNLSKTIIFVVAISTTLAMQTFATNINPLNKVTKYTTSSNSNAMAHAYLEKANAIRAEISTYNTKIKDLREYNQNVNQKLKTLNEQYKTNKSIISSEKMKQIKELRKSIKTTEKNEKFVTEDNSIKSLVENKEYDKALAKLNETLEAKKEQLGVLQERNAIWHQIDALIG